MAYPRLPLDDSTGHALHSAMGSASPAAPSVMEPADARVHRGMTMSKYAQANLRCGIAAALMAIACAATLHAQEAPPRTLDAVVVTGTHIRGVEPVGNTVQVIAAEEIKASGKATVGDFMRELPANFAGGVGNADNVQSGQDGAVSNANLGGGQGVNLRGLGALSTLVLVNGRRVAASGLYGDFVDISTLPLMAVERVEVLLDGASAVYGSDAVGGVVNIILKRRDEGASTTLRMGGTTAGGGAQTQLGQSWGSSWNGGGLLLGYEYHRQQSVKAADRDEVFNGGDFSDRGGIDWRRASNRVGAAANLFSGAAAGNGNVIYTVPGGAGTGLTQSDLLPVSDGVGNTRDPWRGIDILPRSERHSLFGAFEQDIGETVSLYGDLRYSRREGHYDQGYGTVSGSLPATSPYWIPGVLNNFAVLIDDLLLERETRVDSLGVGIGGAFEFSKHWRGEAAASYSREEQTRWSMGLRDTNIGDRLDSGAYAPTSLDCALSGLTPSSISTLADATAAQQYCAGLDYTAFNPYSTEALPTEVLAQLIGREKLSYVSALGQASFKVDGDLLQLPAGALKLALGGDYRKERISGELVSNVRSVSTLEFDVGVTQREVSAIFAEAALPVVGRDNALPWLRALDLSAAVRYERYSGLGAYETTNPKLGFSLKPIESVTVRGSWGTSFHAPPMRFMYDGALPVTGGAGNDAFLAASSYMAPCNTTMVPLNGVIGTPGGSGNCSFTAIVVRGAAGPSLKPEEAETWTVGLEFKPESLPGLKLGMNYFNLKVDDRIVRIQGGTFPGILAQLFATGSSPYSGSLSLNPSEAEAQALLSSAKYIGQIGGGGPQSAADVALIAYATQSNLASLKMDGIDFNVAYGFDTERAGAFDFFINGTRLYSYEVQADPDSGYVDQLGKYSALGNPVKLRSRQGVTWRRGALSSTLAANFTSSYECAAGCYVSDPATGLPLLSTSSIRIGSWTTFDLSLDYDLSRFGGLLSAARLGFTATNLFDRGPPFIDGGTTAADALPDAYDASNATVIGRSLALTLDKRW